MPSGIDINKFFLGNQSSERRRSGREFERYALTLLRAEANAQSKILLTGNEIDKNLSFTDAIAPQGLYDLPGPAFIEVKINYSERFFDFFERIRSYSTEIASFIFIFQQGKVPTEKITQYISKEFPESKLKILGKKDLDQIAATHPDAALAFSNEYLEPAINAFKNRDEEKLQEQHIAALRSAYNDDRLALFLGAGVSKSANFPDWNELIKRISLGMFDDYMGKPLAEAEKEKIYEYFQSENPASPLIVARLIQNSLKDNFFSRLKKELYSGTTASSSSSLVQELGALCTPKRGGLGIVSVVNYNFDDLLETELKSRRLSFKVVLTDEDEPTRSELPIYHVHGYLPRAGSIRDVEKESLVFSEDAYHNQFLDPYLWTNITQLNLLRNNVCLFVGLSLTDPNQRRLLEVTVSKKPGTRHYAILFDHWLGKKNFNTLTPNGKTMAKVFKGLEESAFSNLGISVLWVKDFNDIPTLLGQINT